MAKKQVQASTKEMIYFSINQTSIIIIISIHFLDLMEPEFFRLSSRLTSRDVLWLKGSQYEFCYSI